MPSLFRCDIGMSGWMILPISFRLSQSTTAKPCRLVTWTYMFRVEPSGFVSNVRGRTPPSKWIVQTGRSSSVSMAVAPPPPVDPATTYLLSGVMKVLWTPRRIRIKRTCSSLTVSMMSTPPPVP